jgi:SAM-dependent methyltransferase
VVKTNMDQSRFLKQQVADYYSDKVKIHGATAHGVDWNSTESQWLRFEQLLSGFSLKPDTSSFSLNDYGCGVGEMLRYLSSHNLRCQYRGYDLSEEMLTVAQTQTLPDLTYSHREGELNRSSRNATCEASPLSEDSIRFILGEEMEAADYTVASGIFNVCLDRPHPEWEAHIKTCLSRMREASRTGFSFNMLTSYSDAPLQKDYLYYANPGEWFDYCKRHFSRNVALIHDYDLYEFTIRVRLPV